MCANRLRTTTAVLGMLGVIAAAGCAPGPGARPAGVPRTTAVARRVFEIARGRHVGAAPDPAQLSNRAFDAVLRAFDPTSTCAARRDALAARGANLIAALREGDFRFVHEAARHCGGRSLSQSEAEAVALEAIAKAFDDHSAFVPAEQLSALRAEIHAALPDALQARGRLVVHGGERIALIVLPSFYLQSSGRSATRDVRFILDELARDGATSVVLDLRGNQGGVLIEAARLASALGCEGLLGRVQRAGARRDDLAIPPDAHAYRGPLALWVDPGTAAVAEAFAGALQDHGRARIVGARTRGHGSVQTTVLLHSPRGANQGAVRVTDGYLIRPSGEPLEGRGVEPDAPVPPEADDDAYLDRTLAHPAPG